MRRLPIPPLCGGAVQALPNFQTTLRDHPHPASRPMTFGHFTSWHADDLGYYTGAWVRRRRRRRRRDDARMCPAWHFLQKGLWPLAGARTSSKEFEVRAKVAREAPMDRNVEKPLVFERFSESARVDFQIFWMRKSYVFICFLEVVA